MQCWTFFHFPFCLNQSAFYVKANVSVWICLGCLYSAINKIPHIAYPPLPPPKCLDGKRQSDLKALQILTPTPSLIFFFFSVCRICCVLWSPSPTSKCQVNILLCPAQTIPAAHLTQVLFRDGFHMFSACLTLPPAAPKFSRNLFVFK